MRTALLVMGLVLLFSCNSNQSDKVEISKEEMLKIVQEAGNQFGTGIKTGDTALLANIYSDSAQYVIPQKDILEGRTEIGEEWAGFLKLKEKPIDLVLNINGVRGNREIIYETGQGYTLLADSTKWPFNYVNIWRLQADGSYKLEVDVYN
jgi:ketosteroid isomerase-like protein